MSFSRLTRGDMEKMNVELSSFEVQEKDFMPQVKEMFQGDAFDAWWNKHLKGDNGFAKVFERKRWFFGRQVSVQFFLYCGQLLIL